MNKTFEKLLDPFPAKDIEWRAGATNADKTKAMALAYITSRAVMNRLDEVVGPENWQDTYQPAPSGGIMCGLSIRVNDEWVTKYDGADNTDFEAVKGGFSDAFKRAAVKWGIGRYLYNLEGVWVACETRGKSVVLKYPPSLPAWALPEGEKPAKPKSNGGSNPADEAATQDESKKKLVYTSPVAKIFQHTYPSEWVKKLMANPQYRADQPHIDNLLQQFAFPQEMSADEVLAKVDEHIAQKTA